MRVNTAYPQLRADRRAATEAALVALFEQMLPDVAARFDAGAARLIAAGWDAVLAEAVLTENQVTAAAVAERVAATLGVEFDADVMTGWLAENARHAGEAINAHTEQSIRDHEPADDADHPVGHVFGVLAASGAAGLAASMVTTAGNFAARDTARAAGDVLKTWTVNSRKPRASHARMAGQTVGIDAAFSNGMQWPGDPDGGAAEVADCRCSLTITY